MNVILFRHRLQFEEEELGVREGVLHALLDQLGDDDGATEHAISQAARFLALARRELQRAAHAGLAPRNQTELVDVLKLSIETIRERKRCEEVSEEAEKPHTQNVRPFQNHQTFSVKTETTPNES